MTPKAAALLAAERTKRFIGQSFGKLGTVSNNPNIAVNWDITSTHALQRMAERGVTQRMVDQWVRHGVSLLQSGGQYLYLTPQGVAVVNQVGKLMTTYPASHFDQTMRDLVTLIFGS